MRGVYSASMSISSLDAAKTLILLQIPSSCVVEILSASVSNKTAETNEQIEVGIYRVGTLGSPAGTSITAVKSEAGDATSGLTILGNLSGEPNAYATIPIDLQGVASLAGYRYDPMPEERPIIAPSAAVGLRLLSSPDGFDAVAKITWREIG